MYVLILELQSRQKSRIPNKGYTFDEIVSYAGQYIVVILNTYNDKEAFCCAKISDVEAIRKECRIGNLVTGPCKMPILDFFELDEPDRTDKRAVLIAPRYIKTVADWMSEFVEQELLPEDDIIALLLCGLSAVYSFATHSLCHYDIKLTNIMIAKSKEFVFIDFGSAAKY